MGKKYPKGSVIFKRFEAKIAQVKRREQAYGDRYCGKRDGLPRTVATGEIVRGNVVIPGLMFLYTAGWIGWAGRSYLIRTQDEMKELNIDVPLALTCMAASSDRACRTVGEVQASTGPSPCLLTGPGRDQVISPIDPLFVPQRPCGQSWHGGD